MLHIAPLKPLVQKAVRIIGKRRSKELAPKGLVWRPANGPYSKYEVSDTISPVYGDRGIIRVRNAQKLLLQGFHKRGYKNVTVKNDSDECKVVDVHLLMVVGDKPSDKHTVDHIIPGMDYRLQNFSTDLRWATKEMQSQNQNRSSRHLGKCRAITRTEVETGESTQHLGFEEACTGLDLNDISLRAAKSRVIRAVKSGNVVAGYTFKFTESTAVYKSVPASFIAGHEGFQASEKGGLIMFPNGRYTTGYKNSGYRGVEIGGVSYKVHRLIAAAWVKGYEPGLICNHIDHAKICNNDASNLEWCTHAENNRASVEFGSTEGRAVLQYTLENEFIEEYRSLREAARNNPGSGPGNIRYCCEGYSKTRTSNGFIWKYLHT
jgi:HNH endonuclease